MSLPYVSLKNQEHTLEPRFLFNSKHVSRTFEWIPKFAGSSYEVGPGTASRTGWTGMDGGVEPVGDGFLMRITP